MKHYTEPLKKPVNTGSYIWNTGNKHLGRKDKDTKKGDKKETAATK